MGAAVYQSRSVEKTLFLERFESPAKVHQNGGSLVGGCVPNHGLPLDGTQYATHVLAGLLAGRSTVAFEVEFWPNTDYDNDALVNLWSTTSDDYRVYKTNNAGGNKLGIVLGGTLIEEVLSAAYSAAWVVGGRNVLIVSSNGASTDAWLNGTQILTGDATAWTPTNPATLYTGALADGSGKLDGVAKYVHIRACLLAQGDVDAIQDGSLWSYMNRCNLHLSMDTQTQRPDRDSELITDGDQEDPTTAAYTTSGVGVLTKSTDSPYKGLQAIRCTAASAGDAAVRQNSIVDVAFRYLVTGVGRGTTAGLQLTDPFTQDLIPALTTDWQSFSAIVVAGGPGGEHLVIANIAAMATGEWFEIDQLSVQPMLDQTLDSSRFGHLCTVGNGHGGWPPAFTNPGFEFVNDFLLVPRAESIFNHPFQSLALAFSPNVAADFDGTFFFYDSLNGLTRYALYHDNLGGGSELEVMMADLGIHIPLAAYGHLWRVNGPNVIVVACAHRDTDVMFNGVLVVDSHNHEFTPVVQTEIVLGSYRGKNSSWFMGGQRGFRSWPEKLCRLQMLDVTADMGVTV